MAYAGYLQGMDICSEKKLLSRITGGDDSGFEILLANYSPRILALAWRLTGNREDAEDIAQEAFLKLHRSIGDFRGDSSVGTWLHRTATRLAIDHLRRRKLRDRIFFLRRDNEEADPLDMVPDSTASPADNFFAGEIRQALGQAMERLSARQRVVFTLRHFEEMPLREIAETLQLEEGTVKAHLHRAVHIIRRELKDLREESS